MIFFQRILRNDTSDEEECEDDLISEFELKQMLKLHVLKKRVSKSFSKKSEHCIDEYSYYSSSLLLDNDKYHDRQRRRKKPKKVVNNKHSHLQKSIALSKNLVSKKTIKKKNTVAKKKLLEAKRIKLQQQHEKDMVYKRKKMWHFICKKEVPKKCRSKTNFRGTSLATLKKVFFSIE